METSHSDTISKLKFIGKLRIGDKINTHYLYIQPRGIYTSFARTFMNQDNRVNTLMFVEETITRSFALLETYENTSLVFHHMLDDIMHALDGLDNLRETYMNDTKFWCDISTLMQTIDVKMSFYKKYKNNESENIASV